MNMHPATTLYTYDDYLTLPADGNRYEIIEGEILMTPSPFVFHQKISFIIERILDEYVSTHRCGMVLHAPIDVILSITDIVQPDILYIAEERREIITKKNIVAAPDLLVEIISDSSAIIDRTTKKLLYERSGVKEYWIVDPDLESIDCFTLVSGKFESFGSFKNNTQFRSKLLVGLTIDLQKLFALL